MKTKLLFTGLVASAFGALLGASALAAAVLGAALDDNTPGATRKLRGGQIDYSVLISNTGDANATSVTLANPVSIANGVTRTNPFDSLNEAAARPLAATKPNLQPV